MPPPPQKKQFQSHEKEYVPAHTFQLTLTGFIEKG